MLAQLPAHWASALINGDRTGLTDEDEVELDNYLAGNPKHANPTGASEEVEVDYFNFLARTLLCELLTYTFLE